MIVSREAEAARFQTQIRAFLQTQQVQSSFALVSTVSDLAGVLQQIRNDAFVLPLQYAELLGSIEGPVLLVP